MASFDAIEFSTYIRDSLEQDWLVARALREAESAHRLGALVFVRHEEVVETSVSYVLHEPFASILTLADKIHQTINSGDRGLDFWGGGRRGRFLLTYMALVARSAR